MTVQVYDVHNPSMFVYSLIICFRRLIPKLFVAFKTVIFLTIFFFDVDDNRVLPRLTPKMTYFWSKAIRLYLWINPSSGSPYAIKISSHFWATITRRLSDEKYVSLYTLFVTPLNGACDLLCTCSQYRFLNPAALTSKINRST